VKQLALKRLKGQTSILVLVLGIALLSACQTQSDATPLHVAAEIGATAPEITLQELENGSAGASVTLSDLRGKPVILNFWATWCEPCKEEFPVLDGVYRRYRQPDQLQVIGVNVQDTATPEMVQQYLADAGVIFPIWLDANGDANRAYSIQALPTTVFIDRSGVIRQVRIGGPLTQAYVEMQLEKIK
jgi:cytochrome c biogenesis protein CcmG, thiol:disulfide interchange protein DsbE